jgi:hypothetical protein
MLEDAINFHNDNNITASQAIFQADSVMAYRIVNNISDILLTCDSDQAAILGTQCMCIKDYKYKEEKNSTKIENIEIFLADKSILERIMKTLHLPMESNRISKAKYPVFDGINDPRLRSLIAVGLGCDVNLEAAVTPSQMYDFIKSTSFKDANPTDAYLLLMKFIVLSWVKKINQNNGKEKTKSLLVKKKILRNNKNTWR